MRKLLGGLAVVALLTGCTPATGEGAFIDQVKPHLRSTDDEAGLLAIGRDVCKSERSAGDETQAWASAGFTEDEAKHVVQAAVQTLCPDRKDWLSS